MTARSLQIFVAVAERGRMTEAARDLFITQSSVSQAIADMEREYGVTLFQRLPGGLALTDAGQELLRYATELLELQREMDAFLKGRARTVRLRVGSTPTAGASVLGPILCRLRDALPGAAVTFTEANTQALEDRLLKNELDIALVEGPVLHPGLVRESCLNNDFVLICPRGHRFWGRPSIRLADLAGETLILREPGSRIRIQLEAQLAEGKIPYTVGGSCADIGVIRSTVACGLGVGLLSSRLVSAGAADGRLWACPIEDGVFTSRFDLVYHKNKPFSPGMTCFAQLCRTFESAEY